jgi:hypothetical protein
MIEFMCTAYITVNADWLYVDTRCKNSASQAQLAFWEG